MNVRKQAKGFTIIEVVLVLAIAGLIFLMVFIALPALQRSQRDAARKSEAGTVTSAIQSYMSNNRNAIPTAAQIAEYVGVGQTADTIESGAQIIRRSSAYGGVLTISADINNTPQTGNNIVYRDQLKVWFGYKCSSSGTGIERGTTKQAAVVVALESGPSNGSLYCQNT